jgi:hypothetical protein
VRALLLAGFGVVATTAQAHKASDSYLQIDAGRETIDVRWDIALRDLDAVLDIDTDEDGRLTWSEVKAAWPRIQAYALTRLTIDACTLVPAGQSLERRNDGAYAVLRLNANCSLAPAPVIGYSLLREVDPTHRGIAKIRHADQRLSLRMLDPSTTPTTMPTATDPTAGAAPKPAAAQAAQAASPNGRWGFLREGVHHILGGYDHVLFLLCLLLPSAIRRTADGPKPVETLSQAVWPVVAIVSAFTGAHSITLGLAAAKWVSLSPAFIEPAIAATIILAAVDNVWPIFPVRRGVVAFAFGLIHGFGFAGVLAELNLPTAAFAWALLQFNLGLEIGQLLIVVSATTALFLLRKRMQYLVWVIRGGSMTAMLIAALWLIERTANVSILPL